MGLFANAFTWWNGASWSTSLFSRRHGQEAGRDEAGNVYFRHSQGSGAPLGDLCRRQRQQPRAAGVECLAARHDRRCSRQVASAAPGVRAAAGGQPDRQRRCLASGRDRSGPAASAPRRPAITAPGRPTRRDGPRDHPACRNRPDQRRLRPQAAGLGGRKQGHRRSAAAIGQHRRRDPDGRAGGGHRLAQQAQRDRPRLHAEARPGNPRQGCADPTARLRIDRAVGDRAADRRLRPARRAPPRHQLGAGLFGLAVQGKPVAQRGRASGL